jgi:glycosyltransferase involved in cell wall biosynthesis
VRILFVTKFPPLQGGVSTEAYWNATELGRCGHQVAVLSIGTADCEPSARSFILPCDHAVLSNLSVESQVQLATTSSFTPYAVVPQSHCTSTRLFGRGIELLDEHAPDWIVGNYFQPFGIVASQLAVARAIPLIIRHAGSDVGCLSEHPDLAPAYREMLRRANYVLTSNQTEVRQRLCGLGVQPHKMRAFPMAAIPDAFGAPTCPFELAEYATAAPDYFRSMGLSEDLVRRLSAVNAEWPKASGPIFCVFGKAGTAKGIYDLVRALKELADHGCAFRFISCVAGNLRALRPYIENLVGVSTLANRSLLLPFIPCWRMPALLSSIDVGFVLERNFPIRFHTPRVVREVLAAGARLVVSSEVWHKQPFRNLEGFEHVAVVSDPTNPKEIVSAMRQILNNATVTMQEREAHRAAFRGWERALGLSRSPLTALLASLATSV